MVTVARSFDAPIKLLFPQMSGEGSPSMLGLGDIVVPGLFIALLLRFDYKQLQLPPLTAEQIAESADPFPRTTDPWFKIDWIRKPLFWSCILSYVAGLSLTLGCMYFFQAAQPALLYLVPACLSSSIGTALYRKQLRALYDYKEDHAAEKKQ